MASDWTHSALQCFEVSALLGPFKTIIRTAAAGATSRLLTESQSNGDQEVSDPKPHSKSDASSLIRVILSNILSPRMEDTPPIFFILFTVDFPLFQSPNVQLGLLFLILKSTVSFPFTLDIQGKSNSAFSIPSHGWTDPDPSASASKACSLSP